MRDITERFLNKANFLEFAQQNVMRRLLQWWPRSKRRRDELSCQSVRNLLFFAFKDDNFGPNVFKTILMAPTNTIKFLQQIP